MQPNLAPAAFLLFIPPTINFSENKNSATLIAGGICCGHVTRYIIILYKLIRILQMKISIIL